MKKNHQFPEDVLRCIANGLDTQAKIVEELNCSYSTLCILLRKLVSASQIESCRQGMHNVYTIRKDSSFHDPFGLSGRPTSNHTFMLPPRRQHSIDEKKVSL